VPAYVAKTVEVINHDVDGNLLEDARWTYTYDAENRLLTMETLGAAVTAGVTRQKLTFAYDYLGRRVGKIVQSGWTGSSYATTDLSMHYLYDGWNLLYEYDSTSSHNPKRTYIWGLDLSGTLQGAGGTGGLLYVYDYATGLTGVPAHDALGNIHAIIAQGAVTIGGTSYAAGAIVAGYEYDAFGNTLRESGNYAATNPLRFSSRFTDVETSLVYYGMRYYSPSQGRFINRDTIGEQGGLNLYGFCGNNGVNGYDVLGRDSFMDILGGGTTWLEGDGPTGDQLQRGIMAGQSAGAATVAPNNAGDGSSSGVSATTAVMIASQATTVAAQVAGGAEIARYAKDPITGQELWKGKNGKLYTGNFNGNQHTGGKLNYARAGSNTARVAGRVLFVAGAGFAVNDMYQGARANDGVKVAQGGLDLTVGAIGTWGGPVGWAFAGGYFAGRALGDFIFGPPGG